MGVSPIMREPISPQLLACDYSKEDLYLSHEEREAFKRFRLVLNVSMGTYASSAMTRAAKDARIKGIARACADALVHRTLTGKTRAAGLDSIAAVQMAFDDEITRLHDVYNKNSGGPKRG